MTPTAQALEEVFNDKLGILLVKLAIREDVIRHHTNASLLAELMKAFILVEEFLAIAPDEDCYRVIETKLLKMLADNKKPHNTF